MPQAIIEPLTFPSDHRGWVLEPIGPEVIPSQRNVHLVWSAPGAIRGNHAHARGTEITVVFGPTLVRLREDSMVREIHVPAGQAYRFTLPPGVAHAFQNTGPEPVLMIAFNTEVFDPQQPNLIRDTLIA